MGGIITSSNRGNNIRNLFAGMYKLHGIKYSPLLRNIFYMLCVVIFKSLNGLQSLIKI